MISSIPIHSFFLSFQLLHANAQKIEAFVIEQGRRMSFKNHKIYKTPHTCVHCSPVSKQIPIIHPFTFDGFRYGAVQLPVQLYLFTSTCSVRFICCLSHYKTHFNSNIYIYFPYEYRLVRRICVYGVFDIRYIVSSVYFSLEQMGALRSFRWTLSFDFLFSTVRLFISFSTKKKKW